MCLAKAITGGFAPMGATIVTARVANEVSGKAGFCSTYGWHPYSVNVALANLRWLSKNGGKLMAHVEELSGHFRTRLGELRSKRVKSIRIRGLAIAVETGSEKNAEAIVEGCRKKGLLITSAETAVTMFPPLTLERAAAEDALEIFREVSA